MSATTHTEPVPSAPGITNRVIAWVTGGVVLAALVVAVAAAVWPASETDRAREDGRAFGEAVGALYTADNQVEADAAIAAMDAAVAESRAHAGDAVAEQVAAQEDALARAAEGFAGWATTDSDWDAALYEAELEVAMDDLTDNASDFRGQGPEVRQAYWEGVDEGLTATL